MDQNQKEYRSGPLKGLTPNVLWLGVVSLLADISSEMLYPLNPIFLQSVLGAPGTVIGLIEGLAEGTASILKTVSGTISDKTGKRRSWVFVGYFISALAKPIISVASGWPLVLFARMLDRTGKGIRNSPRDALLADSVSERSRGKAFGWHRGMDSFGAIVGPLLAILLLSRFHNNLRVIYLWAAIPGVLAAFFVFAAREIKKVVPEKMDENVSTKLPTDFKKYLFAWAFFSIADSSDAFLLLRAKDLGADFVTVILMYCVYNFSYSFGSPYLGDLSDRVGRTRILIPGLFIFAFVYFGFAMAKDPGMIWFLFFIYGLYMAATDGVGKALAIDLVPTKMRGRAVGTLGAVTGFATLAASLVAGVLWDHFGHSSTFVFGGIGALISVVLFLILLPRKTTSPKSC